MEHPHCGSGRAVLPQILDLWGDSPGLYSSKIILLTGGIAWNKLHSPLHLAQANKMVSIPCLQFQGTGGRGLREGGCPELCRVLGILEPGIPWEPLSAALPDGDSSRGVGKGCLRSVLSHLGSMGFLLFGVSVFPSSKLW